MRARAFPRESPEVKSSRSSESDSLPATAFCQIDDDEAGATVSTKCLAAM